MQSTEYWFGVDREKIRESMPSSRQPRGTSEPADRVFAEDRVASSHEVLRVDETVDRQPSGERIRIRYEGAVNRSRMQ